jgi:hypothetical protein
MVKIDQLTLTIEDGALMMRSRLALIILLAALVGCASGGKLRVTEGDDAAAAEPVSLAPAPAPSAEPQPAPSPEPTQQPATDTAHVPAQGYAPYGSGSVLELRRIGQWTRTGIGEARRLVIRDANAWAQFWSELGMGERPNVDFTRDVVVAVAAGQRPTGGYEIAVDRVTSAGGELTVEVVERTPGPNCMTTASLTQPVDVVVVPAADARSPSFIERKEIRGCR